ncbi:DUF4333 domain-containing protein [Knoellia sp. p5-6-4]|uniref:DUF4333 domain-containing protein n=1 Tax=unclassified Knoellia TaxID=2618719 RepID=UPI0023DA4583|nr:DUF4333 domain-containing protein [Knoellia sp. p5-6-4]MDF2144847.1 DUF4333 domain-containing protein [Knoellia sp. p5-6-4]
MSTAFTPPGGTTPAYSPYAAGHAAHPSGPASWPAQPMYQPAQRNGLAVAAVVMAGLSLLGVLGLVVAMVLGPELGPSWVLQGEVLPVNSQTSDEALERELTSLMEDDGSAVQEVTCPESAAVAQGEVTVCHGSVDDWDWTGVVHFEDDAGAFTLLQF